MIEGAERTSFWIRTAEPRRDLSRGGLILGPLLCWGGWLAAFTLVGAALLYVGSAMIVAGFVLDPRAKTALLASFGLFVGWGWIFVFISLGNLF